MKHVAPFLGIPAEPRRKYLRAAWVDLPIPTREQLGRAARQLMQLPEREYHYAAYDLLVKYLANANEHFLAEHVQVLLVTKPWWDTVDGLVNAGVSPLARRYESTALIDAWSESGNIWLIRAAIGHQRGWRTDTDVDRVLHLCGRHWENAEFFVAKAIGWALRDLARLDPPAVRAFLARHEHPNMVAVREANRGLNR